MARVMDRPVRTFSVGFKDTPRTTSSLCRKVAALFSTDHHEVEIGSRDLLDFMPDLIFHQDEPIADWVCVPLPTGTHSCRSAGSRARCGGARRPSRRSARPGGDEVRHEVEEVARSDLHLVVIGREERRHLAGIVELVVRGVVLEADGERADRASMTRAMSATLAEESSPPDRKTPNGTSAIMRFSIARPEDRARAPRSTLHRRSAPLLRRRRERIPVSLGTDRPPAIDRHAGGGGILWIPWNRVRGAGAAMNVR